MSYLAIAKRVLRDIEERERVAAPEASEKKPSEAVTRWLNYQPKGSQTASELFSELQNRGVTLWVDGERLRFRARKGVVDAQTIAQLSAHKAEIISILDEFERLAVGTDWVN